MGTVTEIVPPSATAVLSNFQTVRAEVGKFVVIDCEDTVLFGRLTAVHGADQDANAGDSKRESRALPSAAVELLTTIGIDGGSAARGIHRYPRLGSGVYAAPPALLRWLFECGQLRDSANGEVEPLMLNVMSLGDGIEVGLAPERTFGRHCAVLGATGVGKSWTLARLMQEASRYAAKIILFDSTGEFHTMEAGVRHVHIGNAPAGEEPSEEVAMPFYDLTESDLFALFKPSGPTQPVKLRAAIKSLKLTRVPNLATGGVILKAGKPKAPFERAFIARARELNDPRAQFDVTKLPLQIDAECVYPAGGFASNPDPNRWGTPNEAERSECVSLITRIDDMLHAPELACVFHPQNSKAIFDEIDAFLGDAHTRILRISLKYLPFANDAREIVANAVGRHTLDLARSGKLGKRPVVLILDEAHHFLNRSLGEENGSYGMDSFEQIAKEGRKLALNFCIATQRPRDIPEGILSQIGTFIIHRLNNQMDRVAVESASSDSDRSVMAFVPGLTEGQAVIIGADLPLSLPVQIIRPVFPPDSPGPDYQREWR